MGFGVLLGTDLGCHLSAPVLPARPDKPTTLGHGQEAPSRGPTQLTTPRQCGPEDSTEPAAAGLSASLSHPHPSPGLILPVSTMMVSGWLICKARQSSPPLSSSYCLSIPGLCVSHSYPTFWHVPDPPLILSDPLVTLSCSSGGPSPSLVRHRDCRWLGPLGLSCGHWGHFIQCHSEAVTQIAWPKPSDQSRYYHF